MLKVLSIQLFLLIIVLQLSKHIIRADFEVVSTTESSKYHEDEIINILKQQSQLLESLKSSVNNIENKIGASSTKVNPNLLNGTFPSNCKEIQEGGSTDNGIYLIKPKFAPEPFSVLCDMKSRGGGWTHFLNRFDGSQDFYLPWNSYKYGFGNLSGEFWLGLEKLHLLTGYELNELLIELEDFKGLKAYANYNMFIIGNEKEGYAMKVLSGYSGTSGDSLTKEHGMKFTTKDRDQDTWVDGNCADWSYGAWWYKDCKSAQLTGKYTGQHYNSQDVWKVNYWPAFTGSTHVLKEFRMLVRPHRPIKSNPAL